MCGVENQNVIDVKQLYYARIFNDFGAELTTYYLSPFDEQWERPEFQARMNYFMESFPFEQPKLLQEAIQTAHTHNIPLKVLLVENDLASDVQKTRAFFKEQGVKTKMLTKTKHEVFTLTPSQIVDSLKDFEKQLTLLNITVEW